MDEVKEQLKPKMPEHPTQLEETLIKAWRKDGYSDEQIAEFLEML